MADPHHPPSYEPTPDEIEAAAAAIRAGWSEREKAVRAGFATTIQERVNEHAWEVPIISTADLLAARVHIPVVE